MGKLKVKLEVGVDHPKLYKWCRDEKIYDKILKINGYIVDVEGDKETKNKLSKVIKKAAAMSRFISPGFIGTLLEESHLADLVHSTPLERGRVVVALEIDVDKVEHYSSMEMDYDKWIWPFPPEAYIEISSKVISIEASENDKAKLAVHIEKGHGRLLIGGCSRTIKKFKNTK